ncbi:hypothetical protein [Maribellus sediminis]|uniref:hypothetical protein n=1 Tax=Maribellus sediminis TaxID=2696285 RepID=UPI0014319692|nr:hypothetical protein [Maribellus sediminis]
MTFAITYKPLFEVKILHLYYLNKGDVEFFSMNDNDKEKQLAGYDISTFFRIVPTSVTQNKLEGHKLVFKRHTSGFTIWVNVSEVDESTPLIALDDTLELSFLLKLNAHTFFNLTHLDLSNAGKLFFFSNKRLNTESPGFPLVPLSSGKLAVNDDFIASSDGEKQVLKELTSAEKNGLFGVIRVSMKGENASLNVTDAQQKISEPFASFQLLFENRKTYWRYFFNTDQKVKKNKDDVDFEDGNPRQLVTNEEHPLTEKGFVSIELDGAELPNPDANMIKPNGADNKIYSEIYM